MPRRRDAATPTQRQTRQSVNGRSQVNYDMKLHPIDEISRPAHWARRHGLRSPSRRHLDSETEDEEETISLGSGTEEDPEQAETDDEPLRRSRSPDPNAIRRSQRPAARKRHEYRANVHPNDDCIPGYRKKRMLSTGAKPRRKMTPTTPPPVRTAATQKRKRPTPSPVLIASDHETTDSEAKSVIPYQRLSWRESKTPVDSGHVPSPVAWPAVGLQLVAAEVEEVADEADLAMVSHLAEFAEIEQQLEYHEIQDSHSNDGIRHEALAMESSQPMLEQCSQVQTAITALSALPAMQPDPDSGSDTDSDSPLLSPSALRLSSVQHYNLSHTRLPSLDSPAPNTSPANTHGIPSFAPSSPTSQIRSSPLKSTSKDPTLAPAGHCAPTEILDALASVSNVESSPASKIHSSPTPLRTGLPLQPLSWKAINARASQMDEVDEEMEAEREKRARWRACEHSRGCI